MQKTSLPAAKPQVPGAIMLPPGLASPDPQQGNFGQTQIYSFVTPPTGQINIYSATRWVEVQLTLITAGPVEYSTNNNILPVGSGSGAPLVTSVPQSITLASGDRLFIASTAANRVAFIVQPYPWLENMALSLLKLVGVK